jgi:hypothetical protein
MMVAGLEILRFQVPTAVKMLMLVFWVATPYGFVGGLDRFAKKNAAPPSS